MKKLINSILCSLALVVIPMLVQAQYVDYGTDAASVKWQQIRTPHFQVIFAKGTELQAQRVASILNYAYDYDIYTLNHKPKRVSVILHNYSAESNAFAVYAPRRIEYLMCPPQDGDSQDWAQLLAIHEFRHIIQMDKMKQGVTKVLYYIFGEQAAAAVLGLYIPAWFLEGDAVCAETALTSMGRGRSPLFEAKLRAQLLQHGTYSYDKETFGSYKDFVPNQYEFGYFMVGHTRAKYGVQVWDKALNTVARKPLMITPFNRGIRNTTDKSKVKLYKEVMDDLTKTWKSQDESVTPTYHEVIMASDKDYENYESVRYAENNQFIAIKTSIDDISRIVQFERKGQDKIVFTPGFMPDKQISYANKTVCWVENKPDLRWEQRSSTVIKLYNTETKKLQRIDHKTRYFAPDLSPNGKFISVVEVSYDNKNSLVLIDVSSGKVINKVQVENNLFIANPRWGNDTSSVVCTVVGTLGKTIAHVNMFAGMYDLVLPFTSTDINYPVQYGKYIYYTAAYSGMSDICALEYGTKDIKQVIVSRFGANKADISPDGGSIIYSDYTGLGSEVSEATINNDLWKPVDESKENVYNLGDILAEKEKGLIEADEIPTDLYTVKNYSKVQHLFNVHSWAPLFIRVNSGQSYSGISVMSQNVLSTSFVTGGYLYRTKQSYFNYQYKGWYPVLDFTVTKRNIDRSILVDEEGYYPYYYNFVINETEYSQGIALPLNFTRDKYVRSITPSIQNKYITNVIEYIGQYNYGVISYKLQAYNLLKRSTRDLDSKWGQILNVSYMHDPFYGTTYSTIAAGDLTLFFPGLLNHHSISIYTGLQKKEGVDNNFLDGIVYPRGYDTIHHDDAFSLLTTYKLPLFYPDVHLGSVMYIKRVKAALFYDFATVTDVIVNTTDNINYTLSKKDDSFQSWGFDLTCDLHLFRFFNPFELGVRTVYAKGGYGFQILFSNRLN